MTRTLTLAALAVSACSQAPVLEPAGRTRAEPAVDVTEKPVPETSAIDKRPPLPAAKKKRPGPIPTRPISVAATCKFRDETGYAGEMNLKVESARVQVFSASVYVPRHGVCRFDLKSFRQTKLLPTVELTHLETSCKVRVWEQGMRVTVAFDSCRMMCSGNAWPYLWPILADRTDGSCA